MKTKQPTMKTFSQRVVEIALEIPPGRVTTYGHIARAAGGGGQSARSVTAILGKAYEAGEKRIPFHRIVYSGGKVWLNDSYRAKRLKLYKEEGIAVDSKTGKIKNFADILFEFK
jgi:methylated-DNA-protein-cysteine methyltransferase-like protein